MRYALDDGTRLQCQMASANWLVYGVDLTLWDRARWLIKHVDLILYKHKWHCCTGDELVISNQTNSNKGKKTGRGQLRWKVVRSQILGDVWCIWF